MRASVLAVATLAAVGMTLNAQVLSPTQVREAEERGRVFVLKRAEEVERRARATTVGSLNADANSALRRWDEAVKLWKREKNAGAAPLLAEGVLLDCLGRMQGVRTQLVSNEKHVPPPFIYQSQLRPGLAAKLFEAALKIDPRLTEARMRVARIRGAGNSGAMRELEAIAQSADAGALAYLAAVSRAEAARSRDESAIATTWYERALTLHPGSAAATIGLMSLGPPRSVAFEKLDADDPYYSYPCSVMTPDIQAGLADRILTLVSARGKN
jgi:tetratricopeptide (TPR) repeat protein